MNEMLCAACAAVMVYTGPINITLPQGAQTVVQLIDGDRAPVAVEATATGSTAVLTQQWPPAEQGEGKGVIISAVQPGMADVAILPAGEGRPPVAMSVTVDRARPRREGDGPLTLELVLATIETPGEDTVPADDIAPMLAGITPEGWVLGQRSIGSKEYLHWVGGARERARLPAGWSVVFPQSARRLGHSPDLALWEAPAGLGEWQWRNGDGRLRRTGRFGEHPSPPPAGVPAERHRRSPGRSLQEPPEPVIGNAVRTAAIGR